ncbi:MAG: hypothetical protein V4568_04910 [Pseudomonadota bacterium]
MNISQDGGRNWRQLDMPTTFEDTLRRLNAVYLGNSLTINIGRQLNPMPQNGQTPWKWQTPILVSNDYGVSWNLSRVIDDLSFNARPTRIGPHTIESIGSRLMSPFPRNCPEWNIGGGFTATCYDQVSTPYRSDDNGFSWYVSPSPASVAGDSAIYIGKKKYVDGALVSDSIGSDTFMAIKWTGSSYDIQVTMDGGQMWRSTSFPAGMRYGAPGYFTPWYIAYAGNNTIAAYFHDQGGLSQHYLFISPDNGATWSVAGDLPNRSERPGLFSMVTTGKGIRYGE